MDDGITITIDCPIICKVYLYGIFHLLFNLLSLGLMIFAIIILFSEDIIVIVPILLIIIEILEFIKPIALLGYIIMRIVTKYSNKYNWYILIKVALIAISVLNIYLYINSPGGSVTSGLAIYDTMNYITSDVKTICIGMAASMASVILSSGAKGKRCALINADVMIHQPLGGMEGQASDMKIACERILKIKEKLNNILAKNTGKSLKVIEKDTDRDYFLSSHEALKYGLIDEILT